MFGLIKTPSNGSAVLACQYIIPSTYDTPVQWPTSCRYLSSGWYRVAQGFSESAELLVLQTGCSSCRPTNGVGALKEECNTNVACRSLKVVIIIIIPMTMFIVLSSWPQGHCESSLSSFDECRTASSSRRVDPQTKPRDLGCEFAYRLQPPSPFIIIVRLWVSGYWWCWCCY